jgi:hypothetical protein
MSSHITKDATKLRKPIDQLLAAPVAGLIV